MSEESPYTFHTVGVEGEPIHYELRDVSGRVVCKAFKSEHGTTASVHAGGYIHTWAKSSGYSLEDLEIRMRESLRECD